VACILVDGGSPITPTVAGQKRGRSSSVDRKDQSDHNEDEDDDDDDESSSDGGGAYQAW